jgi:dTDP-4-dehydrorhamnose 3,5-epimerase
MFKKEELSLKGVYKYSLENFHDERGSIINLFNIYDFPNFKVDKLTKSKKNVLRGLHGDTINDKLIYCLHGKMHLVIVNYDKNSSQYLQKIQIDMDENSNFAIFVPKNFLNGHYCLSEKCLFYYKWSESYLQPEQQFSIVWNDETLNINWPLIQKQPILSDRDKQSKKIKG